VRYVGQNQTLVSKQLEFTKYQKVPFCDALRMWFAKVTCDS